MLSRVMQQVPSFLPSFLPLVLPCHYLLIPDSPYLLLRPIMIIIITYQPTTVRLSRRKCCISASIPLLLPSLLPSFLACFHPPFLAIPCLFLLITYPSPNHCYHQPMIARLSRPKCCISVSIVWSSKPWRPPRPFLPTFN